MIASHGFLDTETCVAPFDFSMVSAVPFPHANYASDKLIRSIPVLRKEGCNIDMFQKELRSLAWKDARYGCSERRNMMHYIGEVYDLSLEDEDARKYLNSNFDSFDLDIGGRVESVNLKNTNNTCIDNYVIYVIHVCIYIYTLIRFLYIYIYTQSTRAIVFE